MNKILCVDYTISEIDKLASNLLPLIKADCTFIGLGGDLGAGKTTFTRAFCKALGCRDLVSSPTYTLENQYHNSGDCVPCLIHHWDLYRVNEFGEVLEEVIDPFKNRNRKELVIIEWYERCEGIDQYLDYVFLFTQPENSENTRKFSLFSREMTVPEPLIHTIEAEFHKNQA